MVFNEKDLVQGSDAADTTYLFSGQRATAAVLECSDQPDFSEERYSEETIGGRADLLFH